LKQPFSFDHRNRRPPRDPVNALLSFAYTLLQKTVQSALQIVGFDPYIGFLHEPLYGRPALSLDLMEEFRPVIADSVVLSIINNRILTPDDFYSEGDGILLKQDARKKFMKAFDERIKLKVTHPHFGYQLTYLRVIELQARLLAKTLRKEIPEYPVFLIR